MTVLELILTLIAIALLTPLAVLTVECLAALLPVGPPTGPPPLVGGGLGGRRPTCAVLIPAHDEEAELPATLAAIWPQLEAGDRILVIADNCTDGTAAIAKTAGAEVFERRDADRRGKGYALAAGVDALRAGPPDVVVVVDADCRCAAGAIDRLIRTAAALGRPVQATYILKPPPDAAATARLSAWAVRVKNLVRPRGLRRLGLPCLLTGSGMAFPWRLLRDAPLASGNIVEDMRLGIDLAIAGHPTVFEPAAEFVSVLPAGGGAARSQRTPLGTRPSRHDADAGSAVVDSSHSAAALRPGRIGVGAGCAATVNSRAGVDDCPDRQLHAGRVMVAGRVAPGRRGGGGQRGIVGLGRIWA